MERLINAILKLSREGRRIIVPERIEMNALIGSVGASLQHLIDDRDARLEIHGTLARHRQRPAGDGADFLQPDRECVEISPPRPAGR